MRKIFNSITEMLKKQKVQMTINFKSKILTTFFIEVYNVSLLRVLVGAGGDDRELNITILHLVLPQLFYTLLRKILIIIYIIFLNTKSLFQ